MTPRASANFERHEITVRDGKGARDRDRVTMLPERLVEPLRSHLARVRVLHERDLAEGFGEVHMPHVLNRGGRGVMSPLDRIDPKPAQ